jgi:hypothetical protein
MLVEKNERFLSGFKLELLNKKGLEEVLINLQAWLREKTR